MNAIVTGASGGIGKAITEIFAKNGINVWACASRKNESFESEMNRLAEDNHVWIKPVYFSLTDETDVKNGIKSILNEKLPIDILVNNAGVSPRSLLVMTPIDEIRKVMEINFTSQMLVTQLIAKKMMRQKSGNIVNVSSVSGSLYPEQGGLAYGCSKAALAFSSRVLARELADYNIRVNTVSPGFVETSMWTGRSDSYLQEAKARSVMKRMGKPEEIANVVYFLTTPAASYMTGTNIDLEGGGRIAFPQKEEKASDER